MIFKPIKYKRFNNVVDDVIELQNFFDELIIDGYEIIYYSENQIFCDGKNKINVIVVGSKKQKVM